MAIGEVVQCPNRYHGHQCQRREGHQGVHTWRMKEGWLTWEIEFSGHRILFLDHYVTSLKGVALDTIS